MSKEDLKCVWAFTAVVLSLVLLLTADSCYRSGRRLGQAEEYCYQRGGYLIDDACVQRVNNQ